jgi:hypothetical protein
MKKETRNIIIIIALIIGGILFYNNFLAATYTGAKNQPCSYYGITKVGDCYLNHPVTSFTEAVIGTKGCIINTDDTKTCGSSGGGTLCKNEGNSCTSDSQCCKGLCAGYLSGFGACFTNKANNGQYCDRGIECTSGNCCGNKCSSSSCTGNECSPNGSGCSNDGTCCSNSCVNGYCTDSACYNPTAPNREFNCKNNIVYQCINGNWEVAITCSNSYCDNGIGNRGCKPYENDGTNGGTTTNGGTSDGTGTNGGTTINPLAPTCKKDNEIFYSDASIVQKEKTFYMVYYSKNTQQVSANKLDKYIPGFSSKFFESKYEACCEGLNPEFLQEKTVDFEDSTILPFVSTERILGTYSLYKCSTEISQFGSLCSIGESIMKQLKISGKLGSDDCLAGWGILILFLIFVFALINKRR